MSGLYGKAMLNASFILFVIAVVLLVSGFLPLLMLFKQSARELNHQTDFDQMMLAIQSFAMGLNGAFWPFIGAAVLWRADRHFKLGKEAAE